MATQMAKPTGIKGWGVADDQLTTTQRWVSLVALMIMGLAVCYSVFKWNPILAVIGAEHGMDLSTIGNITGLGLLTGVFVCFPAVWIMRQIGVKFSLALSLVITLCGTIASMFTVDAAGFLAARVVEGVGMGMLAAVGPNIVPRLFPLNKMGLAMGVWSQWTIAGTLTATFVGSRLFEATGTTASLNWLGIALIVAALVALVPLFKLCAVDENVLNAQAAEQRDARAISRNYVAAGIICAFCFFGYCWVYGLCQGFYPTFLQSIGWGIVESNNPGTISMILIVVLGVSAGVLFERKPVRKIAIVACFVVCTSLIVASFAGGQATGVLYTIGIGVLAGVVPVAVRTYIPFLVTDPKKMDYVLGIMAFVTNLSFFGNSTMGLLITTQGWLNAAALFMGIPVAICTVAVLLFVKSDRKIAREEALAAAPQADSHGEQASAAQATA